MASFTSQVDNWVRKSEIRMDAVFKQSAQDLSEAVQEPRAKGGRMPVDTGFLRNSFGAAVNSVPKGNGGTDFDMQPVIVAIVKARLGDRIIFGWAAEYSKYMEARYSFLRSNAQNWDQIVRNAVKTVKRDYDSAI